jgi:hypothetical protein
METDGQFVYPEGRSESISTRVWRGERAQEVWTRARRYARLVWVLPYIRMVAVTGALAMDNVEAADDIDLLIVAEPGRIWLARALTLLIVKLARARGDTVCPNYVISAGALQLEQRDLYTAHELAQMVPLHGGQTAARLWAVNSWCLDFLPNASLRADMSTDDRLPAVPRGAKALGEAVLNSRLGTFLESWERRRKIAKLSRATPPGPGETSYTRDVCKGHAHGHGSRILARWAGQVAAQNPRTELSSPDLDGFPLDTYLDLWERR